MLNLHLEPFVMKKKKKGGLQGRNLMNSLKEVKCFIYHPINVK